MLKLLALLCLSIHVLVDSSPLDELVIEEHVVGGNDTDISKVPYQVSMLYNNKHWCGGFIVKPNFVVTAAHCITPVTPSNISIRAGSSSNKKGGVVVKIKTIYMNPNYTVSTSDYDVAIIELATPLKFNDKTIKPIKLATEEPAAGSEVLVSGWGCINEHEEEPKTLQSATFPVYDRKKCQAFYEKRRQVVTSRMICAGTETKTAFYGDSGGPLVKNGEVVGIVSWGSSEGNKYYPGVYCNIAHPQINKFIKDHAKL